MIVSRQDGSQTELLAWDPDPKIKLKFPFQEIKAELQFGEYLGTSPPNLNTH
jgi:hypothetical protein